MANRNVRYRKPRGNLRTEVTTAFGVEGAVEAAQRINNRTKWLNSRRSETMKYEKARGKITLPSQYDAWLKKEI